MTTSTAEIWDRFSQPLRSFILRRIDDPDDADDVLQDVFIKIHSKVSDLQDEERLAPWLYQVTRNTVFDYYRRKQDFTILPESLAVDPEPIEAEPEAQIAASLQEMIACLPEKYRQALLLTEIQGLKQKDLAAQMGITLSGAKSRVQRGRELLRDVLLNCCHFEFDLRGRVSDYISRPDCCQTCQQECCS